MLVYVQTHTARNCARNPTSPPAKKMQRLRPKMSQEKKDAHREKDRLSKNAKHHTKTQEECAKHKKTNRDCIMRKPQTEMLDQAAKRKKTNCDCIMRTQTRLKCWTKLLNARRLIVTVS